MILAPLPLIEAPSACLWLMELSEVDTHFTQFLGADERHRYMRFTHPQRQRQFLAGRLLLRHAISHLLDIASTSIHIKEQPHNAPRLIIPDFQRLEPGFSLTHSGDYAACIVGLNVRLGLDIERINNKPNLLRISQTAFHADEHAWLLRQTESDLVAAFYKLWSFKEALFKLTGRLPVAPLINAEGGLITEGVGWYKHNFVDFSSKDFPNYSCAVCSTSSLGEVRVVKLESADELKL